MEFYLYAVYSVCVQCVSALIQDWQQVEGSEHDTVCQYIRVLI